MPKSSDNTIEEKLDKIVALLQHLVALELSKSGATQAAIRKHLRVAKSTVVEMLRGVNKRGKNSEQNSGR
jgi:DNA-binding MarR family transcriptional regulator